MKYYDIYLTGGHIIPIQDLRDNVGPMELLDEFKMETIDPFSSSPKQKLRDSMGNEAAILSSQVVAVIYTGNSTSESDPYL